ncbi:MAG: mechanosensitive ion channel domain-containing protein [Bacteroidales bacterium]|jgi:small-conductance mechanosensitive channel|nr:mechanosensitive ion channel domain-containing protein [Bacteroidales bacterium]
MNVLQMNLKDFLEYSIIKTDSINITVYNLVATIFILLLTRIIIGIIHKIFRRKIYTNRNIEFGKSHTIYQLIKYVLWTLAILLSLETMGIKITFLLAGSAALLVGLGLGLQQIFRDIVSGLFILFEGNLKVNDVVELDGEIGRVKETGFRTTKIESRDNIILVIPNSKFIDGKVINWSHIQKRTRFNVKVGVAYGSDVKKVEKVLTECALNHSDVIKTPRPFVRFSDFGDSSLDFQLFFWTDRAFEVENIKSDLRFAIDEKFRENKIQIPFPQRDVHIIPPKNS